MRRFVAAAGVILAVSLLWGASTSAQQPKKKPATAKKSAATKKKSSAKTSSKSLPRQGQPDSARSREIQEALQKNGYLKTEPSGKWDKATTDAFAKFQQDHGRKPTGKPDAHSLQDMGLGAKYDNLVQP